MVKSGIYGIRKPDFNSVSNTQKRCDLIKGINLCVPQFPHQQMKTIIVPTLRIAMKPNSF